MAKPSAILEAAGVIMRYLVHFKCLRCGWLWSVASDEISDTVNGVTQSGCPRDCGIPGQVLLVGHETFEENGILQMLAQGYARFCGF
jgi:hypothetical protein